jgi:hypothetical protein
MARYARKKEGEVVQFFGIRPKNGTTSSSLFASAASHKLTFYQLRFEFVQ